MRNIYRYQTTWQIQNESGKKRYGGIDLLKHILALFVIFQHMKSKSRYPIEINFFISDVVSYISGAVIGFFLISGFFFRPSSNFRTFISKAFKRIIIPYFLFAFIYKILMAVLGKESLSEGLLRTLTFGGAGMQLYFLPYLFFIYILYGIFFLISKKANISFKSILITTTLVVAMISITLPTSTPTGPDYKLLPVYLLSFGIGALLANTAENSFKNFLFLTLFLVGLNIIIGLWDYRFYHIAVMSFALSFCFLLSSKFTFLQQSFNGSGGVYLLHTPIVNFTISSILLLLGISNYENLFISWGLTYIFCLFTTLFFIRLLPSYKWILLE